MGNTARALEIHTWDDYRAWRDDRRWEIIGGQAFAMSPSPGLRHQIIQTKIGRRLDEFFDGKPCRAIVSPIDVKFSDTDVAQPDVLVVCRCEQIKPTHIEGPPTLVVEILSDATEQRDRGVKMRLYAAHGVPEVWLVRPFPSLIEVYRLDGKSYRLVTTYSPPDTLRSPGFPKLRLKLDDVFDFPPETEGLPSKVREESPPAYGSRGRRRDIKGKRRVAGVR